MSFNFQPSVDNALGSIQVNPLLAKGPYVAESITIEQDAGVIAGEYVVGRLLNKDVDGKYHLLANAETTVALGATTEVVGNNLQAASGTAPIPFVLAKPPIPGTVSMATTTDGSATPVQVLGTDNGRGMGVGAGGRFTIDYDTGQGVAYLAAAVTNGDDLKAGYKHRTPDAADSGETLLGLPRIILAEDVDIVALAAGDVVTVGWRKGGFNEDLVLSYSAGYKEHLRSIGIELIPSTNA